MRRWASTLSPGEAVGHRGWASEPQKTKAPSRDGAFSKSDKAELLLLVLVLALALLVLLARFRLFQDAGRDADAAVLEVAVRHGRRADRRRADFAAQTAHRSVGRCAGGEQHGAQQQRRSNDDFAHRFIPVGENRASTPLKFPNIKRCAPAGAAPVSYTHLTLPTNREV